jgi:hypothetical protein
MKTLFGHDLKFIEQCLFEDMLAEHPITLTNMEFMQWDKEGEYVVFRCLANDYNLRIGLDVIKMDQEVCTTDKTVVEYILEKIIEDYDKQKLINDWTDSAATARHTNLLRIEEEAYGGTIPALFAPKAMTKFYERTTLDRIEAKKPMTATEIEASWKGVGDPLRKIEEKLLTPAMEEALKKLNEHTYHQKPPKTVAKVINGAADKYYDPDGNEVTKKWWRFWR